ncbi:hypothetical protein SAMD00019534_037650 [Acytostelium subglobosum LB1]|uniref:hypothetical protein n=1 Tax=Acytostelium subglobosum LB1 TaxID=1410327 RepID=UPI000644ED48|nr:hypothetical protein SAMD00019534_037650 [Acytostelium subglobosum LB1]GAM20590.1 hypothetical protein SAMD00019534_037650 [Acytostelium subglobosum LB1]|eukprot:XP_012760111.1 hypothetical protein SAMD00019534_037650 [Acytostelium subglobosum LB1]
MMAQDQLPQQLQQLLPEQQQGQGQGQQAQVLLSPTQILLSELVHFAALGDLDSCTSVCERMKKQHPSVVFRTWINETDINGNSALHWACYRRHLNVAKFLIARGADVDLPNTEQQQTPLHWACLSGDPHLVYYLIGHGADMHKRDKRGLNTLLLSSNLPDLHIVRYLLYKGMSVANRDDEGHTPLHWAAFSGSTKLVRYFLRKGADLNSLDNLGRTPFHWATYKGYYETTMALFEEGASLTIKDKENRTPYELALTRSTEPVLRFLKQQEQKKHPSIDQKSNNGYHNNQSFWLMLALVGNLLLFIITYCTSLWVSVPTLAFIANLARILFKHYWLKDTLNPFPIAWWIISCIFCYWSYVFLVLPDTGQFTQSHLAFNILSAIFFYCLCKIPFTDPGVIKSSPENDQRVFLDCLEQNEKIPEICTTCQTNRPIRSKHCRVCKHCVARYDHHCVWINNCVGAKNHRLFVLLLLTFNLAAIPLYYMTIKLLLSDAGAPTFESGHYWSMVTYYFDHHRMISIFMIYGLAGCVYTLRLLASQIAGVLFNFTMNEVLNITRYTYLREGGRWNVFNRGILGNTYEFLYEYKKWYITYTT